MLRYVVLRHETNPDSSRPSHWDLMFEDKGQLLTWALPQLPATNQDSDPIACQQLARHRMAYLEYEGDISGDRGTVTRWDHGTFKWKSRKPNEMVAVVSGEKLRGIIKLAKSESALASTAWSCSFQPQS